MNRRYWHQNSEALVPPAGTWLVWVCGNGFERLGTYWQGNWCINGDIEDAEREAPTMWAYADTRGEVKPS